MTLLVTSLESSSPIDAERPSEPVFSQPLLHKMLERLADGWTTRRRLHLITTQRCTYDSRMSFLKASFPRTTRALSLALAFVFGLAACRLEAPPVSPKVEQERNAAITSARHLQRDADTLDGEQEQLQTERRQISEEMDDVQRPHVNAVQQHDQGAAELARYEEALAQAKTISSQQCESLEGTPLSTVTSTYDYFAQFENEFTRDQAIKQLESCRKKTARRMKKLAGSGPSDAQIKKVIIEDSISQTPGSCPCPYHAASNGSRCGRRSSYSKYGGEHVTCYSDQVSREMVQEYRSRLVADPLLALKDDFADPWTAASGDMPVPVEPIAIPLMPPEMSARVAELEVKLQQIDDELAALSSRKAALLVKAGGAEREVERVDQREQERQGQWRMRAEKHAQNTQVAGVVIMITGIVGTGAGAYGFYEISTTKTAIDQERDAQALNELLGVAPDMTKVQELERQLDRQKMLGAIGLSVGIPLIGLGVLLMVASSKRQQSLKGLSVSAGQLRWRF